MKHLMRTTLCTALSTAIPFSVLAQVQPPTSSVQIYGFLKVDAELIRSSGPGTTLSMRRLSNNLSVLGFRATEDLGGGLAAFAQFEGNVTVDTGAGPFAGRNTGVGLRGPLGQVLLGVWESPMRFVSVYAVDPFTAGIFASNAIMGNGFSPAPGANRDNPHSFDRRQANLIQYFTPVTPAMQGFSGRLAYGPSEERDAQSRPDFLAALLSYSQGPWFLAYGLERHKEYLAAGTADLGQRIGVAYTSGPWRVSAAFERLRWEPSPSSHVARNAVQAALTYTDGPHVYRASLVQAQSTRGNANPAQVKPLRLGAPGTASGAHQVSLGYGYKLSKRTELWGAYTRLHNQSSAIYNLSANGFPGLQAGQSPSGLGLGITHSF